ncbi:hypothetical protein DFH08DRAFT_857177 [Mycena albidolilacea]|uniref:BTB domain-containing protein n=1 Tax=Mycena albidolilacea TaxID=1033008 RepID=A0AAD7AAV6_9AGAR|nr:hypothetical protein DFH08DRAFT_857177 [Mycena albidolilacea]
MSQLPTTTNVSDARPAKRQRTESELTRSDIWYDDGSVVLQAEATQFRVHWSILSLHSTFFRDMRTLPQPADEQSVEGCPVVELHDSSTDLKILLRVLYDPLFNDRAPFLDDLASIIRLGRKYNFENLLASAVQRLTYEHPTTLDEFEKLLDETGWYRPTKYIGICFDVINVAQENGLLAVLPSAYLRAIVYFTQEHILKGFHGPSLSYTFSAEAQHRIILGGRKIIEAQWTRCDLWDWLSSDLCAVGCTSIPSCLDRKKAIFQVVIAQSFSAIPFQRLASGLCATCGAHHAKIMAEGRKKLWEDLPTFFDLPPWAELKNDI